jgi:hypothetical protein
LEAKLQVWRYCSSLPLIRSCFHFLPSGAQETSCSARGGEDPCFC